jgi:poly(A) polymerase
MGARMAREILGRLRQSNDVIDCVVDLVARHLDWRHIQEMRESTLRRFLRRPGFDEHLELHRLDCESSHRRLRNYAFAIAKRQSLGEEDLRPTPLIGGDDLIGAGLTPGPAFRRILEAVEDAQLEGRLTSKADALAFALRLPPERP